MPQTFHSPRITPQTGPSTAQPNSPSGAYNVPRDGPARKTPAAAQKESGEISRVCVYLRRHARASPASICTAGSLARARLIDDKEDRFGPTITRFLGAFSRPWPRTLHGRICMRAEQPIDTSGGKGGADQFWLFCFAGFCSGDRGRGALPRGRSGGNDGWFYGGMAGESARRFLSIVRFTCARIRRTDISDKL